MKKVFLVVMLIVFSLSACDALGVGGTTQGEPPESAELQDVGYLTKFTVEMPNALGGVYKVVAGGVDFSCRVYEQYPDNLYCFGPRLPEGEHEVLIYAEGQDEPMFTLALTVPALVANVVITATLPPPTPTTEPTAALQPTATSAAEVTPVAGALEPTATVMPTIPAAVTPTLAPEEAIKVYYFSLEEKGPYGCGEAMYWVKTSQPISGNLESDISYALRSLFNYHQEYFGTLYNPYAPSQFAVGSVEANSDGTVVVNLTGTYEPTGVECDPVRLRDQIKQIILQFPGIIKLYMNLNGSPLADALSRK